MWTVQAQWVQASLESKPGQIGYDCDKCKRRNRIGTKGRDCIGHSISKEEFYVQLRDKIKEHETNDLEILCRRIGKGVCIKSFPTTRLSVYLVDLIQFCKEFHSLPCEGSVQEQPNLFFEAYRVINSEIAQLEEKIRIESERNTKAK